MEYKVSEKFRSLKPSAIREIFKSLGTPGSISFAAGNPNPDSFPVAAMKKIADEIFEKESVTALQYGITEGYAPLRKLVAERLKRVYGIGKEDDELIIVTGGQQGIELTCKVMCNEGNVVLCENPSFIGALNAFRSLGARLVHRAVYDGVGEPSAQHEFADVREAVLPVDVIFVAHQSASDGVGVDDADYF